MLKSTWMFPQTLVECELSWARLSWAWAELSEIKLSVSWAEGDWVEHELSQSWIELFKLNLSWGWTELLSPSWIELGWTECCPSQRKLSPSVDLCLICFDIFGALPVYAQCLLHFSAQSSICAQRALKFSAQWPICAQRAPKISAQAAICAQHVDESVFFSSRELSPSWNELGWTERELSGRNCAERKLSQLIFLLAQTEPAQKSEPCTSLGTTGVRITTLVWHWMS